MEDQNLNLPVNLSPSSTQNESDNLNNPVVMEVVEVDAGSDTGAKSEPGHENVKRGRGRPRKYEVSANQLPPVASVSPAPVHAIQPCGSDVKRGRGRPRGSGKLQILASIGGCVAETAGGSITPYVLTVNPGEDVVGKILTFFQKGPRAAVCILSATGTVSSVTLQQPGVCDSFLRYEGRFEILSLAGSCTYTSGATGGAQRKIGMLSVSLAKPDGRVFGGGVESSLIAATPIQLVLATFKQNISTQIKRKYSSLTSTSPNMVTSQDSERDNLKVPKITEEGEPSYLTETTTNSNGGAVAENVIAETTNEVSDNVTVAEKNVQSDSATDIKAPLDFDANLVPEI